MKDSVIIVSGGMDSITLLYDKKDEIALGISFNCTVSVWASSTSPSIWVSCISISKARS